MYPHVGGTTLAPVARGEYATGPTGHLLHKATSPRLGDITKLPNTQKVKQRIRQNEREREIYFKQRNKKNSRRTEFKVMIMKMLRELRRTDGHGKRFNNELKNRKKKEVDSKNIITERLTPTRRNQQ